MSNTNSAVRKFSTAARSIQMAEKRVWITPAVEATEGGPLSAYRARFGPGESAELPAPYQEVWVVISGRIRVTSGREVFTADVGEFLHVPECSEGWVEALEETELISISVPAH